MLIERHALTLFKALDCSLRCRWCPEGRDISSYPFLYGGLCGWSSHGWMMTWHNNLDSVPEVLKSLEADHGIKAGCGMRGCASNSIISIFTKFSKEAAMGQLRNGTVPLSKPHGCKYVDPQDSGGAFQMPHALLVPSGAFSFHSFAESSLRVSSHLFLLGLWCGLSGFLLFP